MTPTPTAAPSSDDAGYVYVKPTRQDRLDYFAAQTWVFILEGRNDLVSLCLDELVAVANEPIDGVTQP